MDVEEFLKHNNPHKSETYVFVCGQIFIDDLEEILKYNKNKGILA